MVDQRYPQATAYDCPTGEPNSPQGRNSTTQRDNLKHNSAPSTNQQVKWLLPTKRETHQREPQATVPYCPEGEWKFKRQNLTVQQENLQKTLTSHYQRPGQHQILRPSPAPITDARPITKDTTTVHNQQGWNDLTPHGSARGLNTNTAVQNSIKTKTIGKKFVSVLTITHD